MTRAAQSEIYTRAITRERITELTFGVWLMRGVINSLQRCLKIACSPSMMEILSIRIFK